MNESGAVSGRFVVGGMLVAIVLFYASIYLPSEIFLLDPITKWESVAAIEVSHRPELPEGESVASYYQSDAKRWATEYTKDPFSAVNVQHIANALLSVFRTTQDLGYLNQAEATLNNNLHLEVENRCDLTLELAKVLLAKERFADATVLVSKLEDTCKTDGAADALRADIALAVGEYQKAETLGNEFFDTKRPSLESRIRMGRYYLAVGDEKKGLSILSEALKHTTKKQYEAALEIRRLFGQTYFELGVLPAAEHFFTAATELEPRSLRSVVGLGEVAAQRQQYTLARDYFQYATSLSNAAYPYFRLSDMEHALGEIEKSKESERRGITRLTDFDANIDFHAANIAWLMSKPDYAELALVEVEREYSKRPESIELNVLKSRMCRLRKDKACEQSTLAKAATFGSETTMYEKEVSEAAASQPSES